ncbi:MAG: hypothetical protein WCF33_07695 [Pseudonocardiaceae bacterium]
MDDAGSTVERVVEVRVGATGWSSVPMTSLTAPGRFATAPRAAGQKICSDSVIAGPDDPAAGRAHY